MVNPAHQQLLQVHQLQQQHKEQLDKMRHVQRQLMHQPEMSVYKQVDVEQKQLKQKLEEELQYLHKINRTYVLEPQDLHKYTFLRQELELQLQQLELFMRELQLLLQPPAPRWYATLLCVCACVLCSCRGGARSAFFDFRLISGVFLEITILALPRWPSCGSPSRW
jgi:hypothetical protein